VCGIVAPGGLPMNAGWTGQPSWTLQQDGGYLGCTGHVPNVAATAAHDRCCLKKVRGTLSARSQSNRVADFLNRSCAFDACLESILLGASAQNPFLTHRPNSEIDRPWPVSSGL
jgi:hypothetical protein